jgi:hypothetical protein
VLRLGGGLLVWEGGVKPIFAFLLARLLRVRDLRFLLLAGVGGVESSSSKLNSMG